MKKKPTAQSDSPVIENINDGFSIETSTTPTPIDPPVTTPVISTPVPSIDKNAELKIETVEVPVVDELPPEEKSGKLMFILGTVVGLLIVAGVISFSLIYYTTPPTQKPITVAEPTTTPTPQVTEAPKQVLKKEEISFEVLNSTKTAGQAAKYSKTIESLGFKVSTTGNSEEKVTGLKFFFSSSLDSQKEQLITDLKKEFPDAEFTGTLSDSINKIRLIIGN